MFGLTRKKHLIELGKIYEELCEHVWLNANFRDKEYRFIDQNEKRPLSNLTMDPIIKKHWLKYHDLRDAYFKIKNKIGF